MVTSNSINANSTGLVRYNGSGTFSGVTVTDHNLLIGAASNGITSVAPSATSGVPVISQGAAADPAFGTVAIAGGGTNATSFTQSAGIVVYNGTSLVNYAGPQIDSSGRQTNSSQPAFFAYLGTTVTGVTGDGTGYTIAYDTELYDRGSNFASNIFTAPVTGLYHFDIGCLAQNVITAMQPTLVLTTTTQTYDLVNNGTSFTGNQSTGASITVLMNATNTAIVQIYYAGGTKVVDVFGGAGDPRTFFCGYLVS